MERTEHNGSDALRRPARLSQGSVREHHLALVLGLVAEAPGLSRAEVASGSGLTRATVSSLVETLQDWGFVVETGLTRGSARTGAGRPATGLALDTAGVVGLGVEINVDYLATCVLDLAGQVRSRDLVMSEQRGGTAADALRATARCAARAIARARAQGLHVAGIGIAAPGLVRSPDGPLVIAPNLGWRDVDVIGGLRADPALGSLPMTLDNEANTAALTELMPAGRGSAASFVYVSGEIGVGAALVVDGRILRGTHGWSGELGHVTVDPNGPACTCGARGCLEQYAGQEAILRAGGVPTPVTTSSAHTPSVDRIVALAEAGSGSMLDALDEAGRALGIALSATVNLLDVTDLVLGGSLRPLAPWITPPMTRELDRRVVSRPWTDITVRPAVLATEAAVTGAAASVVRALLERPAPWRSSPAAVATS